MNFSVNEFFSLYDGDEGKTLLNIKKEATLDEQNVSWQINISNYVLLPTFIVPLNYYEKGKNAFL